MKSSYPFGSSPNLGLWHHHTILKTHIQHYDIFVRILKTLIRPYDVAQIYAAYAKCKIQMAYAAYAKFKIQMSSSRKRFANMNK